MASKKNPVDIPITATDYASAVIDNIEKKFSGLNQSLNVATARAKGMQAALAPFKKIGAALTDAGKDLTMGLTLPIEGVAFMALKTAASFETTMLRLQAATDAPADAMKALQGEAFRIGKTTQFSASEAASAMVELGKAGFSAADIMKSTQDVVALAGAEFMKMDEAAMIVSDTMNQFGLAATDTARISDVLTYAAGKSTTDVKGLAEALKFAGGASRASGISFEETNAALAILANRGMKGSMAGTALSTAFERIKVDPQGIAALKAVGVSFDDLFSGTKDGLLQIKSISSVLKTLENKKMNDRQLFDIFGQESGRAIKQLIGQSGEIDRMTQEMTKGAAKGFAKKQNDIKSMGLEGQLARLKATLEVLLIGESGKEGLGLLGAATKTIQKLTAAVTWFSNLSGGVKKTIAVIAGIAAIIGPALLIVGALVSSIVKIGGAIAFVLPYLPAIGAALSTALFAVGPFIAAFAILAGAIGALHYSVIGTFGTWGNFFSDIWDGITALWRAGIQGIKNMWGEFVMWIDSTLKGLLDPFSKVFGGSKKLGIET